MRLLPLIFLALCGLPVACAASEKSLLPGAESIGRRPDWMRDPRQFADRLPFIDAFGQYRHATWTGKVASDADITAQAAAETADLAARPTPAGINGWGGWLAGPALQASGRFRVEQVDGRWWLVDPDGRLFFSHGITTLFHLSSITLVGPERQAWFADRPWEREPGLLVDLSAHLPGAAQTRGFSFFDLNQRRKHGPDWKAAAFDLAHRRLRSWGFNTIGNWSEPEFCAARRTPYVRTIPAPSPLPSITNDGRRMKLRDPFDPGFAPALAAALQSKDAVSSLRDPWCIGWFIDNELDWHVGVVAAVLRAPAAQPARRAFRDLLERRHGGDIAAAARAWHAAWTSWEACLADTAIAVPKDGPGAADAAAYLELYAETYFATVAKVLHEADPQALYLGCRFVNAKETPAAVYAACARHADVISVNPYVAEPRIQPAANGIDRPFLATEFHFGGEDRVMPRAGVGPPIKTSRAEAYRRYVEAALRDRRWVGTHWFQWCDQPATARFRDDENLNCGFVDVTDRPYEDLVGAARELAARMYQLRAGGR
jgi:hypothetical protein